MNRLAVAMHALSGLLLLCLSACNSPPTVPRGTIVPSISATAARNTATWNTAAWNTAARNTAARNTAARNTAARNTAEWSLPSDPRRPAIGGYDPVAYFPEGGGVPALGEPTIALDIGGVRYLFANEVNRKRFIADPGCYEPAHGGWCSWAMRDGVKTEVDPRSFILEGGRLFLFYDGTWGDTRALWLETEHARSVAAADAQWREVSGENPRLGAPEQP